ncbi:MAG TPA: J domain-containing protein [Bryobacteraceae bacterium]|nr:J domain-containing protein [Bryobacteraceae bacterium]
MNYYEEFGVVPNASKAEIRQAYKTLARLVHPDGQPDEKLRAAAERQMKRINELFAILTDPRRRRAYDDGLRREEARDARLGHRREGRLVPWVHKVNVVVPPPKPGSWTQIAARYWFGILIGTTGLVTAIAWYAMTLVPGTEVLPMESSQAVRLESAAPEKSERPPKDAAPRNREASFFRGKWLYAPGNQPDANSGEYPAMYMECSLREDGDAIVGTYRARYRLLDHSMLPDVNFQVRGLSSTARSARLAWAASDGATGVMELTLRSPQLMKMAWWTTSEGRGAAPKSGEGLLIRQGEP